MFDPAKIQDHATYAEPHHYVIGMKHVFVNGVQVLEAGEHTGATPGRFVHGVRVPPRESFSPVSNLGVRRRISRFSRSSGLVELTRVRCAEG